MKPILRIVILGGVLLVLAAAYFIMQSILNPESSRKVYSLGNDDFKELYIKNANAEIRFSKSGGQWQIDYPAVYQVDQEKLSIIEKFLKDLPINRVIKQDEVDASAYGIDNPEITVTFKLNRGKEYTLLICNLTTDKAQRYVKDSSRPDIYIVDIGYISQFEGSVPSFRIKDIFTIDKKTINGVRLSDDKNTIVELNQADGQWRISQPFEAACNNVFVTEQLVGLRNLKAVDYVQDTAPDLKKFGLDPVMYTLTLTDASGNQEVMEFGNDDGGGLLYMRLGAKGDIIKVFADDAGLDGFDPIKLLGEVPLQENIDNVNSITILDAGEKYEFGVNSISIPPSYTYGGKLVNEGDFITFYVKCIGIAATGYEPWKPDGTPEITFIFQKKTGTETKLELYKRDDKTYYMSVDQDDARFYTSTEQIDLVRKWLDRVVNGQ